ncbi:MAG: bile acid:sodium symporter family protein [Crocinitomicaceae bacterium]|nr:bile acid:sodium symporter family protein [Crocinitomicaceae bacterium]
MEQLIEILLPVVIGTIMFGIGLNLTVRDFKNVFVYPKSVVIGLVGQLVLLPAVAFLIAFLLPIDSVYKMGLVLLSACPGGTSSNIVTFMLKGKLALSVSITAINSFLIVLTIPIILTIAQRFFYANQFSQPLSFQNTLIEVVLTVLLPVLSGVFVQSRMGSILIWLKRVLRWFLPTLLFLTFGVLLLLEQQSETVRVNGYFWLIVAGLILNLSVIALGFVLAGWARLAHKSRYTIAIEMGLQNSALAIFLANNVLMNEEIALMAVVYGSFSFFTTLIFVYILKNRFHPAYRLISNRKK